MNVESEAYDRLKASGIRPSAQRMAIMQYLLTHPTHPTVDDVYRDLVPKIETLSRTTVYNTLRMFAEQNAAQMITIDDHRVCYDGNIKAHVHFYCKECGKVIDFFDEEAPVINEPKMIKGNMVEEEQLYYKGICADCLKRKARTKKT